MENINTQPNMRLAIYVLLFTTAFVGVVIVAQAAILQISLIESLQLFFSNLKIIGIVPMRAN